jgi:hypothetical protein
MARQGKAANRTEQQLQQEEWSTSSERNECSLLSNHIITNWGEGSVPYGKGRKQGMVKRKRKEYTESQDSQTYIKNLFLTAEIIFGLELQIKAPYSKKR